MKKTICLLILVVLFIVVSGCSSSGNSQPSSSKTTPAAPNTANTAPAESNSVNIQGFSFNPATLAVKKGTTVTWTNNDSAPHQVKSSIFSSSKMDKGQTFSFTFNEVGTFDYICSFHPSMTGKIIVE